MKHTTYRAGWAVAVLALAVVACVCGPVGQAQQGLQTAQAAASEVQGLATQAQAFATQAEALATQIEQSGLQETAQALATQAESGTLVVPGQGETPEDIPLLEDRQNFVGGANYVTYTTGADYQTVVDFYKKEMPAQGWTASGDAMEFSGIATLSYSKDNRQAQVVIAGAEGQTSVVITITP